MSKPTFEDLKNQVAQLQADQVDASAKTKAEVDSAAAVVAAREADQQASADRDAAVSKMKATAKAAHDMIDAIVSSDDAEPTS